MEYRETMERLKSMGTEQNRKVYARHGVGKKMFGVSYANLGGLKREIKVDQGLAERLWASGNHDARVLATMIADPERVDDAMLEEWAKDLDNYVLTDAFTVLAGRAGISRRKMEKWTKSKKEWIGRVGWGLLAGVARTDTELPNRYFEAYLNAIETNIHKSKNRVRDAMNSALISIAMRNERIEKTAVAAAIRIGKVEVDHGKTNCKTPDAIQYIAKAKAHYEKKQV